MVVVVIFQVVPGVFGWASPAVGIQVESSLRSVDGGHEAVRSQRGGINQEGGHATGGGSHDPSDRTPHYVATRSRGPSVSARISPSHRPQQTSASSLLAVTTTPMLRARAVVIRARLAASLVPGLVRWQASIADQPGPKSAAAVLGSGSDRASDAGYRMQVRFVQERVRSRVASSLVRTVDRSTMVGSG